jgi:hypothetical protein
MSADAQPSQRHNRPHGEGTSVHACVVVQGPVLQAAAPECPVEARPALAGKAVQAGTAGTAITRRYSPAQAVQAGRYRQYRQAGTGSTGRRGEKMGTSMMELSR